MNTVLPSLVAVLFLAALVLPSYSPSAQGLARPGSQRVQSPTAPDGTTRRVSVASDGTEGYSDSYWPSISADGRYVAFDTYASNLVGVDTNDNSDVFVHDLVTGLTMIVSINYEGTQENGGSYKPCISADGCYVAFVSYASNLIGEDTNGYPDIYVRDLGGALPYRIYLPLVGK